MKNTLKNLIASFVHLNISILKKFSIGRFLLEEIIKQVINQIKNVKHENTQYRFSVPNELNEYRAKTFSIKEPETLSWIDQFREETVFWDIGANVGLYSIYAAKTKRCNVYSFEPSIFNLEILARNIFLNQLVENVKIIPLPLTNRNGISKLEMSSMDWGGALSTFGHDFGHDGKKLNKIFEFSTFGITMEFAVQNFKIPNPDYIKIDVDGIEHLILSGGEVIIKKTKEILLELNEDFAEQETLSKNILIKAGFVLKEKHQADILNNITFRNTYNQIWMNKNI